MNAAIQCCCGNVIVYSTHHTSITCPRCETSWMQQPELFNERGECAKRLPRLRGWIANNPLEDCVIGALATDLRSNFEGDHPDTFTIICDDKPVDVPMSLTDFAHENFYKLAATTDAPPAPSQS